MANTAGVATHPDPNAVLTSRWTEWHISPSDVPAVDTAAAKKMYIGVGYRAAPTPGGPGALYIDDIRVTRRGRDDVQE